MLGEILDRLGAPALEAVPVVDRGGARPPPARALRVATWNISWAQGWGSELSGSAPLRSAAAQARALQHMAAFLAEARVDVALLQEVDLAARRSADVDQAAALAERAGFRWIAAAASWDVPYLPYPYWPPSRHTGRVRSGGAILSRYPLSAAWIERLPKPASRPPWYRAFYPSRYLMGARLDLGEGRALRVVNTHLEAYDGPNRQLQAGRVASRLSGLARDGRLLFGGDLNTVPPSAPQRHDYPDEPHTDHRGDLTYPIIARVPDLRPAVDAAALAASPPAFHTFPAHAPNRMLDHLFVAGALEVADAAVGRAAGDVSDHLPLLATLRVLDGR